MTETQEPYIVIPPKETKAVTLDVTYAGKAKPLIYDDELPSTVASKPKVTTCDHCPVVADLRRQITILNTWVKVYRKAFMKLEAEKKEKQP